MALNRIIAHKRAEIAGLELDTPVDGFEHRLAPSRRSLREALERPGARFIMEYKKASPSRGVIRSDITPEAIAAAYGGVADAISVLVDGKFFAGSLDDMRRVRDSVAQPVLCKDVVVAPYQIYQARLYGADAVLLMLSVLGDEDYLACAEVARRLNLDIVTEVHDAAEVRRAIDLGATIFGINNRDLRSLKVDLGVTARLAGLIPADRLIISESGIEDCRDVRRLAGHADAFLVGSSLMTSKRIDLAARRLVYGRVKVCGHTGSEGLQAAYDAGAVYGGLIFARQSRRRIDLARARRIARDSPLPLVGVFVNQSAGDIVSTARALGLKAVQLHGDESGKFIRDLRAGLPDGCQIWKAVRVRKTAPERLPREADRVILDSYMPAVWGGTGQRFNWWDLGARRDRERLILAGGLAPDNAAEAAAIGTWALDVNSGVEQAPGIKDGAKLERFFAALRPPARAGLSCSGRRPDLVNG